MNYLEQFRLAKKTGVPIVVIRTPDNEAPIREINEFYREARKDKEPIAMLRWTISTGIIPVDGSTRSEEAAALVNTNPDDNPPEIVTANPVEALRSATNAMPDDSILFMMNLHIPLEDRDADRLSIIQGVWNMRDRFKPTKRMLVLLVPDLKIPPELVNDVIVLDMPLPTDKELREIVVKQHSLAQLKSPSDDVASRATEAISGLSTFMAEQVTAMSLRPEGIDLETLWERKKSVISQIGGLSVHQSGVTFDSLGGLENVKLMLRRIIAGKKRPRLVILIDEIEKAISSGESGDSGVGMDALGQMLSNMQDNNWSGMLFPGFPGTGKTEIANAMGNEAGGLFIKMDIGGLKDKWVGNSEKMIRQAMKMLKAMGGANVFFIGTTNSMDAIRPELKRRFRHGNFFFDFPTKAEQKPIWDIYLKKFGLKDDPSSIDYTGWTGGDIKNVCEFADELSIPLTEAKNLISPAFLTMGRDVGKLRRSAHNKYLSASKPGFYVAPATAPETKQRSIDLN